MKLILSLILIISITLFNSVNSISIQHNTKPFSIFNNKLGEQVCFTKGGDQLPSYQSGFVLISVNGNTQSGVTQESSYEQGIVNVDYENQRIFTSYGMVGNGVFTQGSIWLFGSNNTEYLLTIVNDQEVCYVGELTLTFPSISNIEYVGDETLGTFPTEVYKTQSVNTTDNTIYVSKLDCTITAAYSQDNNKSAETVGFTIQNLINYTPGAIESYFNLPSICVSNPTSSAKLLGHKVIKPMILSNIH